MANVHEGHRQRIRQQFLKNGIKAMPPHQILEFLLFYAVPRADTNETAHRLIEKFGNLPGVFNASVEELVTVNGITENAAVLLKLIPRLLSVYSVESNKSIPLDNIDTVLNYFIGQYIGVCNEQLRVCCLDDKLNVVDCSIVQDGVVSSVPVNVRKIAETVYKNKCTFVIISHNHPTGLALPSEADIESTKRLYRILHDVGITLLDHVIVADTKAISMKYSGFFDFE